VRRKYCPTRDQLSQRPTASRGPPRRSVPAVAVDSAATQGMARRWSRWKSGEGADEEGEPATDKRSEFHEDPVATSRWLVVSLLVFAGPMTFDAMNSIYYILAFE
jgi:hypothetical protein